MRERGRIIRERERERERFQNPSQKTKMADAASSPRRRRLPWCFWLLFCVILFFLCVQRAHCVRALLLYVCVRMRE